MPTHDPREVRDVSRFESILRGVDGGLIAFDGCPSAGKTALMNRIAVNRKWPAIDFDPYIECERGEFVNALRLPDLTAAIACARLQSPVVLVAGVCMREVLERIGITAVQHVYVQRNSPMGIPGDLDILDLEDGRPLGDTSLLNELDLEVATYHARYRPRSHADIIYVRTGVD
jgi:hypothetical protein